jgi:NTP pyrophosphatase (non-canonical NTP hydrolase)
MLMERLEDLIQKIKKYRDWIQFHNPKNLSEAIIVEAGELLEKFLWLDLDQAKGLDEKKLTKIKEEVADIFIFLLYLCDVLKIDLLKEADMKISINKEKYPIAKAKGTAKKYTDL